MNSDKPKITQQPCSPARILVVDDEWMMLDLLERFLGEQGYEVISARDGKQALDIFRDNACDLLITDMRMPRMDGLQLLKAVKDADHRLPVVFISGFGEAETVVEALKAGAENFLAKPLDLERLKRVIEQILSLACIKPKTLPTSSSMRQTTHLEAPSHPEHIGEMVYQLALSAVAVGFAQRDMDNNLKVALAEALTNAMEHGNQWDPGKKVSVESNISCDQLEVSVRDQGKGFDHRQLCDPTLDVHLLVERGRGVFLMNTIMDRVYFNQAGNQVTLVKTRNTNKPV
jgi:DNA-binding response OmpR family regulator